MSLPLRDSLYRVARILARSDPEAEDLLQATYLEACRSWETIRDKSRCRQWMLAIMRRIRSREDGRARRQPVLVSVNDHEDLEAVLVRVAGLDEDHLADVDKGFGELSEDHQYVLTLVVVEGLSYEEASEVIGCPVGTIRSRLARARGLLAVRIGRVARRRDEEGENK